MEALAKVTNRGDESNETKEEVKVEVKNPSEDGDQCIEGSKLQESGDESDLSEAELQNCLNKKEEKDETEESELSLHTSPVDDHLFEDSTSDSEVQHNKTADLDSNTDETDSLDEGSQTPTEELFLTESKLHCALCGNLFSEPKLLSCLHTFCFECLQKRKKEKHRLIICPLCKMSKTIIPKDGILCLPNNVVAANLVMLQSLKSDNSGCVVCLLHGEEKISSFHCVDCGDTLCEGCCEKHTFSRQTAKHTVVPLLENGEDNCLAQLREKQHVYCEKHQGEEVKFFCEKCSVTVCRDCILLEHGSHPCITPAELIKTRKSDIIQLLDSLKKNAEEYGNEDSDEGLDIIKEEEEKQVMALETAMKDMMTVVEKKFNATLVKLKKEFERRRVFCAMRTDYIKKTQADLEQVVSNIDFLLDEGKAAEIVSVEQAIKEAVVQQNKKLNSTFPKVSKSTKFPKVEIMHDNLKTMEKAVFCKVVTPDQDQHLNAKTETKKQRLQGQNKKGTSQQSFVRNNDARSMRGVLQNQSRGFQYQPQSLAPSLLSLNLSPPRPQLGRGRLLQEGVNSILGNFSMQGGNWQQNMGNQQNYFRGNAQNNVMNQQSNFWGQNNFGSHGNMGVQQGHPFGNIGRGNFQNRQNNWSGQAGNLGNVRVQQQQHASTKKKTLGQGQMKKQALQSEKIPMSRISSSHMLLKLKLQSAINVKVMKDLSEPEIAGLTFTSLNNFAVSDARNQRVKLFSTCGKFVDMLQDPGPMAITTCNNLLVWNSQLIHIKVYDITTLRGVSVSRKTLKEREVHPVTAFKNQKYLVGNVHKSSIEAYQSDGTLVHAMEPKDREGDVLQRVTQIATHNKDQIVLLDDALKRVVVNDFDGKFIGEYSELDWSPGCVCIDHNDNIFVTDSAANRLIMLSPRGAFLHAWQTMLERPYCVSSNKKGSLLVSGQGKMIHLYEFE